MRDTILYGDCRKTLGTLKAQISIGIAERPRMCVTSPPYYGLRDYGGQDNQIGLEQSPEEYVNQLVEVMGIIITNQEQESMLNNHLPKVDKTYLIRILRGQIS